MRDRRLSKYTFDYDFEEAYRTMIATEAEGDDEGGPIDIMSDDAEAQSFGTDEGDAPDTEGGDEGSDDIAAGADDTTSQMEDDLGDDDFGDPGEGGDDEDMDTPSGDMGSEDTSSDMGEESTGDDIYSDPNKIAETKQLMVHLYNNIKDSIETISSITLLYTIKTDRLELVKNDLLKLNSIIFNIVTSKKESKNYPELLKKYYGCKEFYGVKLEIAIQIIKDEISEINKSEEKNKKGSKRKSKDTN